MGQWFNTLLFFNKEKLLANQQNRLPLHPHPGLVVQWIEQKFPKL